MQISNNDIDDLGFIVDDQDASGGLTFHVELGASALPAMVLSSLRPPCLAGQLPSSHPRRQIRVRLNLARERTDIGQDGENQRDGRPPPDSIEC